MDNKLSKYVSGELKPTKEERGLARQAQPIYDEVRLAALKIEGTMALAGHAMKVTEELDQVRRRIAANDEVLNQICAEYELEAVRQAKTIQANIYNKWGLG